MIGRPVNNLRRLGSITEVVADLVANQDAVIVELARTYPNVLRLATWIRSLPRPTDGPVDPRLPPPRLRIPARDPSCLERAALYLAVAELIHAEPMRQLATLDTATGLRTFAIEDGVPVILDPRVPRSTTVARARPPVA